MTWQQNSYRISWKDMCIVHTT